jgi:diacylglycerol kinase family enzyme
MADHSSGIYECECEIDSRPAKAVYDSTQTKLAIHYTDNGETPTWPSHIVGVLQGTIDSPHRIIVVSPSSSQNDSSPNQSLPALQILSATNLPAPFVTTHTIQSQIEPQPSWLLHREQLPTTHIVISTTSGTGLATSFHTTLLAPLLSLLSLHQNTHYLIHPTTSAQSVTQLTQNLFLPTANTGLSQRIILLSGDGGVTNIVNSLMHGTKSDTYRAPLLVLLPAGTGNALAHSAGLSRDGTEGLSAMARGVGKGLPLLRVEFSMGTKVVLPGGKGEKEIEDRTAAGRPLVFGAVVASWGLHASLVADSDSEEYRRFGLEGFQMAARENLFPADGSGAHAYRAKVLLKKRGGNEKKEGWVEVGRDEHSYVLATLVSNLEKDFVISPDSKPLDGRLRVVHFGHFRGEEVMRIMDLAYQGGKHVQDGAVGYEDVEGVRIDFAGTEKDGRWRRICVDGTIFRVEEDGWVEITKEPSQVLQLNVLA